MSTIESTVVSPTVNLIGIDPGSSHLGVCILSLDGETLAIQESYSFTIHAEKSPYYEDLQNHPDRFRRILALEDILYQVFMDYRPILVCSESPFYNRFRPNAYGVLVEVIECVKRALYRYEYRYVLRTLDPPSVKKAIGASSKAKKEDMQEALSRMDNLNPVIPFHQLDEHAVDATAVAYGAYKNLLGELNA